MSSGSRSRTPLTRATSAGGIVFRSGEGGGRELLLGRRKKERDGVTWSLPKGTPSGHETIEQTALREVTEETGLQVRILAPLGPIHYYFVQRGVRVHKTVHYFLMEAVGGDLEDYDKEFDEVRWIPFAEAETLMSFPTEREIVVAPSRSPPRPTPPRPTPPQPPRSKPPGSRSGSRTSPPGRHEQRHRGGCRAASPHGTLGDASGGRRAAHRVRWLGDARPVQRHHRGASQRPRARRPVRPVAHG